MVQAEARTYFNPKGISMNSIIASLSVDVIAGALTPCGPKWAGAGKILISDPFSRLYWLKSGSAHVEHHGKVFDLFPGSMHLIPANSQGRYWCEDRMDLYWVHFKARILGGLELFDFFRFPYEIEIPKQERKQVEGQWKKMIDNLASEEIPDVAERDVIMRTFLLHLFKEADFSAQGEKLKCLQRFAPALSFIEKNITKEIMIGDLSASVNLQTNYFTNLFTKYFGTSPVNYINLQRIKHAQNLLQTGNMQVKEIASACGFSNQFYFSKVFRDITGLSPVKFRERESAP
ncbi:MAG TPA: hypothetical protein DCZ94_20720 [Lentisphaeria bacterium]|nr:MAG: hypothetical protein A2X48_09130 [Lentisphaerae bacterium GWF2_49_21]HBC89371.1 hypothetical protein [Lentisphaeria bacterium]